jgi:hypothetical protein
MSIYYTIANEDTHKPLGTGSMLATEMEVVSKLTMNAGRKEPIVLSEWYVTKSSGDGGDDDEIIDQMNADEFVRTWGRKSFNR